MSDVKMLSQCCGKPPKGGLTIDPTERWFGKEPKPKGLCGGCGAKSEFLPQWTKLRRQSNSQT